MPRSVRRRVDIVKAQYNAIAIMLIFMAISVSAALAGLGSSHDAEPTMLQEQTAVAGRSSATASAGSSTGGASATDFGTIQTLAASGPANDDFANAQSFSFNTSSDQTDSFSVSTVQATLETGEDDSPGGCDVIGKTVWYHFKLSGMSGTMTLNTTGSNFDTTMAIYRGTNLATLALMQCNEDQSTSFTSRVSITAFSGLDYYVQVGGEAGASGNLKLNFDFSSRTQCTGNDNWNNACEFVLNPSDYFNIQSTHGATMQSSESSGCGSMGSTVWYRMRAPPGVVGRFGISTSGSNYDTVVAVWTERDDKPLARIDCSGGSSGSRGSTTTNIPIAGGVTYLIQVGGFNSAQGHLIMSINAIIP